MTPARPRYATHCLRFAVALASLLLFSCSLFEKKPALLWTDTPEMLVAAEMFNASQSRHILEVHYVEDLANALLQPEAQGRTGPSIVIGKGLRTGALSSYFQSLEYLFGELVLSKGEFYPSLLEGGVEGGRQLFIPVSFNVMLLLNKKNAAGQSGLAELTLPPTDASVLTMDEIRRLAVLFNGQSKEEGERMGFSPRWPDRDFLFQWIQLHGALFGEKQGKQERKDTAGKPYPVAWSAEGLDGAIAALRSYISDVNGSAEREDAFAFKYLFAPGYKSVESGKILFAAMDSASFFLLSPVARSKYEYRYFAEKGRLALREDIKYAGLPRRGTEKETAEQFLRWFFNADSQKAILEKSRSLRISESAFGIGGGFSSLRRVTETLFPGYYTDLLGHSPPEAMLLPPEPIPPNWYALKSGFLLPWLETAAGRTMTSSADADFSTRLTEYLDKNPDLR